jgi:hypothetical protein
MIPMMNERPCYDGGNGSRRDGLSSFFVRW